MAPKVSLRFKIILCASVAAIAAVVTSQVAMQAHSPLGIEELKIDIADIQSYAAEGGLLASQRIGVSVTGSYAKAHTEMWRQKIDELARKYGSREPQPKWAQPYGDVRALANQLHAAADEVSGWFAQNETAGAAAAHLKQIESRARALKSRFEREAD